MRYFVTGATGFIGGELVRQLLAAGDEVVALVRDVSRASRLAQQGVQLANGDLTDKQIISAAMQGADGVFHVAGWYKVGDSDRRQAWAVNVEGTRNVLEAMRDAGVPRGVYTSTLAVFSDTHGHVVDESYRFDGKHLSVYDQTKWAAHYEVAEPAIDAGLPLIVVQPGAVYGVGDQSPLGDTLRTYLRGRLTAIPGKTAYCWGHLEDTARAHILAMQKGTPGQSYIIAGPPHTLAEALAMAEGITGVRAPRMTVPPGLLRGVAAALGMVPQLSGTAEYLRVAAGVTYLGSNARAVRELGYAPRDLKTGLQEVLPEELRRLRSAQ